MKNPKFRIKNRETGAWEYFNLHDLLVNKKSPSDDINIYTLSQFTGLTDSKGQDIFEGDYLTSNDGQHDMVYFCDIKLVWRVMSCSKILSDLKNIVVTGDTYSDD